MSTDQKKEKILAAIQARGWASAEIYWDAACELRAAGLIRMSEKFTTGGNRKPVWVAA
jgi:hypothetical protein